MPTCREVKDLLKEVERQGFTTQRTTSQHYKIKKNGRVIASLPSTPGGGSRAIKQILRREKKKLIAEGFEGELW